MARERGLLVEQLWLKRVTRERLEPRPPSGVTATIRPTHRPAGPVVFWQTRELWRAFL